MAKSKKTKLIMSRRTKVATHHPTSKHVAGKGRRKGGNKKVMVKC